MKVLDPLAYYYFSSREYTILSFSAIAKTSCLLCLLDFDSDVFRIIHIILFICTILQMKKRIAANRGPLVTVILVPVAADTALPPYQPAHDTKIDASSVS